MARRTVTTQEAAQEVVRAWRALVIELALSLRVHRLVAWLDRRLQ